MISVIIPFMAIEPYVRKLERCVDHLKRQTADKEILICQHGVERYIRLNSLFNMGVEVATGDYLWVCNADFVLDDETLLSRMKDKLDEGYDCLFPTYISPAYKKLKATDGAWFMRSDVMRKHGPFNDRLIGISSSTFVFTEWCLDNLKWYSSDEFMIEVDQKGTKRTRVHYPTFYKCKDSRTRVSNTFKKHGLWAN